MKLSVVIVNWNTGRLLIECLESVAEDLSNPDDAEVFVVDNASSDGSPEEAVQRYPQIRLIRNSANPGFAAANNQAIQIAQGELVLLLNPDTRLHPGALPSLLQFLDGHPDAGAVGPRLLNPDGSLQYSCSPAPTLRREFLRLFRLGGVRPDGYDPMEIWRRRRGR